MLRVIDFRSEDKDDDSDDTLFQSNGKTLRQTVPAGWQMHNKCSLYL